MTLNEVALLLTEPLVRTGVCDSLEQALKHIVPWSESHNDDPRNGLAL